MGGAAPQVDSKYQDGSRVVACPRSVILALRAAVLESFTSGPQGGAEVYGILFGTHGGDEVRIAEFQAISFQSALAGTTPLSDEERKAFAGALGSAGRRSDPKGLEPVGWFRAHPHSELTLTPRDLEIASTFFPEPHQVVMILLPSDSLASLVRFFYREADGILKTDSPFCECTVPPNFEGAVVADVRAARNAQMAVAQGPSQAAARPGVNQPAAAAQDASVMYFPEPPRPPRRRIRLVWPVVLAAVLGLLLGWYWLARAPERLALRVFDTGGQLRILWDPVAKGEAGKLEITDGSARFTIALDPDQLRSGTFAYTRHSERVTVRLLASRRGAEPLVEAASFVGKSAAPIELNPPPAGSASREGPKPSRVIPAAAEKPLVLAVPVTVPVASPPKSFSAPVGSAPSPAEPAPDLAPPPVIAQSAPLSVPAQVEKLSPPVEKPAPPVAQPAANVPVQAAQAPAARPAASPRGASTAASGRMIWIGRLQKNQDLVIIGKFCSTGTLIGELPAKPVRFSVSPGGLSNDGIVLYTANSEYANNVIESPGPQNGWNKTTYTWNPKFAHDVIVTEAPSAQNQWNHITLHSKNPKISVVIIDWALVN